MQAKKNFMLESDVRYLDSRIALLIANRMALDDMEDPLEESGSARRPTIDDKKLNSYANLFYLLVVEPRHIASLCSLVSPADMDMFLQTVMFTIYGNQYDEWEEHLLLTMFQSVLSTQFKTTADTNSLLRANTPVSRMMSTYTRRGPGHSFLKRVLTHHILEIIQTNKNLEIDPKKVAEEVGSSDTNTIVQRRTQTLIYLVEQILKDVTSSIQHVPYGIRWICKQIRSLARRRYPDLPEANVCSLIGSFFFLRYINAAIVMPQTYTLTETLPSKQARRTLIMIAKILQNLVNSSSYTKESFMDPMQPFLDSHKPSMMIFLQSLCNVGDFYDTLEVDQYLALAQQNLKISISLNEMFFMHGLIHRHLVVLAPNPDTHLAQIMQSLGQVPSLLPRKENQSLELKLFSRWEASFQDLKSTLMKENNMTRGDILYVETKSLFVQLLRLIPCYQQSEPIDLRFLLDKAMESPNEIIQSIGKRASGKLGELKELRIINTTTQQDLMAEEVKAEFEFLDGTKTKMKEEKESLQAVLNTLSEHYMYLQSQLDTYKSYLQNVRESSGTIREQNFKSSIGFTATLDRSNRSSPSRTTTGHHRFPYEQLQRSGIIEGGSIPSSQWVHVYFQFSSPLPCSFLISMHDKGREEPVLEIDIKLDDLLEKLHERNHILDVDYVQFNIPYLQAFLMRLFGPTRRRLL